MAGRGTDRDNWPASEPLRRFRDLLRLHDRGQALTSVQPGLFSGEAEPWARVVRELNFSDIDARADFEKAAYTFADPAPLARDLKGALSALAEELRATVQRMDEEEAYVAALHLIGARQAKDRGEPVGGIVAALGTEMGVDEDTVAGWIDRAAAEGTVAYEAGTGTGAGQTGPESETLRLTEEGARRTGESVTASGRTTAASAPPPPSRSPSPPAPGSSGAAVASEPGATDDLEDVAAKLDGTDWIPFRELGRGGGGVVYLCANQGVMQSFQAHADLIRDQHRPRAGQGGTTGTTGTTLSAKAVQVVPALLERLLEAVRDHNAIAAVKIPYRDVSAGFDPERFRREVAAMRTFNHPALIRLLDADARTLPEWVAVEFHSRGALDEERNRSKYLGQPLEALRDVRPVAEALGMVHQGAAIHRDVKPKNIFIADDGRLVLGDFGIVLPEHDSTQLTGIEPAHSRDWVPDWVRFGEERTYTPIVDVFALGKVIFYLIAGKNVMASQLSTEIEELKKKYPDAAGLDATVALLQKSIVAHEDDAVFSDAVALTRAIDQILARDRRSGGGELLFSFQVAPDPNHWELPRARGPRGELASIRGLTTVRVRLGRPARSFEASARLYGGTTGAVGFRLAGEGSDEAVQSVSATRSSDGASDKAWPGDWTPPIVLRCGEVLQAGWHDLLVSGVGDGMCLSGFVLYAID